MSEQEKIRDKCPSCGHETLFIGSGGWVTCSWLPCQSPGLSETITRLHQKLATAGDVPSQVCALKKHVCSSCGLGDEEYAERKGFNAGISAALDVVEKALSPAARFTPVDQGKA